MDRLDEGRSLLTIREAVLVTVGMVLFIAGVLLRAPVPMTVAIDLATTTGGAGQVFTASAGGYSEALSVTFPLQSDGRLHTYRVGLPGDHVPGGIRLDPGAGVGDVDLRAVRFSVADASAEARLATDVRLLNQLVRQNVGAGVMRLHSIGGDPSLEVTVPERLKHWQRVRSRLGAIGAGVGLAILVGLGWLRRRHLALATRAAAVTPWAMPVFAVGVTWLSLGVLGVGCESWVCSPRAMGYGGLLFLAALTLAAVGGAVLHLFERRAPLVCRPFLWIGIGQTVLVLYVCIRSSLHAVFPALPLAAAELPVVAAGAIVFLVTRPGFRASVASPRRAWLLFELGLLAAVCAVIADRELPRLLMLSSDPDLHAYLAHQLGVRGGIPWGENVFHYPAGSAALTWTWARLSMLDVRNALTALPLLQSFLAALVVGEAVSEGLPALRTRALILVTVLVLTGAAFLVPVFASYSHMEGAGRQIAIGFMALLPIVALSARMPTLARVCLTTLVLFVLAILNPVNVLLPCLLVACIALRGLLRRDASGWLLVAFPLMLACLLLDPYFQALLGGDAGAARITLSGNLHVESLHEIFEGWGWQILHRPGDFLGRLMAMTARSRAPLFAACVLAMAVTWSLLSQRRRVAWPTLVVIAAGIAALFAADALFAALTHDRRFYLLSPYFAFSIQQFKFLFLTAVAAAIVRAAAEKAMPMRMQLTFALCIVLVIGTGMRLLQPMALAPRWSTCGSLGCLTGDDSQVMQDFAAYVERGGVQPGARVLVPNSLHHAANEAWIFPVAGARALPFAIPVPVAFYYYQGDEAFTTDAYVAHVCRRFDRAWLRAQRVVYVFLPAGRAPACMAGMEGLPETDRVLFRSGPAYLLELR